MNSGRILFAQLLDFFPQHEFNQCVRRYGGNNRIRQFSCFDQFLCMAFAQLTGRESLRDIETCLRAMQTKLYHAGLRGTVARSTLADANESRDWRIYGDFGASLIQTARGLYANDDFGLQLDQPTYALDSTTVDLCLKLFPWAHFRKRKAAVKMHTLLDLRGNIPSIIIVSNGKMNDVNALDDIPLEAGAIYLFDRGYNDYERFYRITQSGAFFVTRAKSNFVWNRMCSHPVDKTTGVVCDQTIRLSGVLASRDYPDKLRRVCYHDATTGKRLEFLTNQFLLPALTIAQLYKCRWQVELFFKWIKQHLRIKAFFGTSENAVKTQIWIAISVYVLVAIVKKRLKLENSLYTILQILDVALFEKTLILQALSQQGYTNEKDGSCKQLDLFDF